LRDCGFALTEVAFPLCKALIVSPPRQHHRDRDRINIGSGARWRNAKTKSATSRPNKGARQIREILYPKGHRGVANAAKLHESSQLTFMKIRSGELSRTMPPMLELMDERRWL
jgi:hypothetical protein